MGRVSSSGRRGAWERVTWPRFVVAVMPPTCIAREGGLPAGMVCIISAGSGALLDRSGALSVEPAGNASERRYEAAARMMATALERAGDEVPAPSVRESAHEAGVTVGALARREAGPRPGKRRRHDALLGALRERGYEPVEATPGEITLGNCQYHALVEDHRDLVCGMNLAWAEGVLDGIGKSDARARLDPEPGRCCVVIGDRPSD